MRLSFRHRIGLLFFLLYAYGSADGCLADSLSKLFGAWQEQSNGQVLAIESTRIIAYENKHQSVRAILHYEPGVLTLRNQGLKEAWSVTITGKTLKLERNHVDYQYRRLGKVPPEVKLKPFPLGESVRLSPDRVQSIQAELHERKAKDQEVLKGSEKQEVVEKVLSENLEYLKSLIHQIGWIDTERFGRQASADAILMAKHGNDLSLLQTILPLVERDFKNAGDDAQMFTILYDGLQIDLGLKQRYGTQLWESPDGVAYVLPMENPAKVDQFRRELGLPPLAEYLLEASKALYEGKPIQILKD